MINYPMYFQDIGHLSAIAQTIDYMAKNSMNQIAALERGMNNPHIFDGRIITQTIKAYTKAIEHCVQYGEQLNWWLNQDIDPHQRSEVERLFEVNQTVSARNERILDLCGRIKQGSIDKVMAKDNFELGLKALKAPTMPAPVQRFEAALAIHQFVEAVMASGGGDEEIINNPKMIDFAMKLMGITNSAQPGEVERLSQMFSGFHRFAKIIENMMSLLASEFHK